jgi:hypothetical protein
MAYELEVANCDLEMTRRAASEYLLFATDWRVGDRTDGWPFS